MNDQVTDQGCGEEAGEGEDVGEVVDVFVEGWGLCWRSRSVEVR